MIRHPGKAQLILPDESGRYTACEFPCQMASASDTCQVPVYPKGEAKPEHGHSWSYEGSHESPTLHPSVNCMKGVCWHGWIKGGVLSE